VRVIKIVFGILVAVLALASAVVVINRLINYNGSAFESGGIGGSITVTLLAAVGSVMLFKSAFKKTGE
jgi:hypothetical protein